MFVVGSCWLFFTFVCLSPADEIPVQYCAQPTNGVVYFRAVSSLNTLPEELKPYVPLFCSVITKWEVYFLRSWSNRLQLARILITAFNNSSICSYYKKERLISWFPAENSYFPMLLNCFPFCKKSLHCLFVQDQHKHSLNRLENFYKREIA